MADLLHGAVTHELVHLTHTNAENIVAVCSCGWIGSVHLTYREQRRGGSRGERVYEHAEDAARVEHRQHARG